MPSFFLILKNNFFNPFIQVLLYPFKKLMPQNILSRKSLLGILFQTPPNNPLKNLQTASLKLKPINLIIQNPQIPKRHSFMNQLKQKNPQTPNINFFTLRPPFINLRRQILPRSANSLSYHKFSKRSAKPEISQFHDF